MICWSKSCIRNVEKQDKRRCKKATVQSKPPADSSNPNSNVSTWLLDMAEVVQRFFHPSSVDEMLDLMLPRLHGDDIDSILATQAFLVHFLPFSHPQRWLAVCE
jgi:hypothetical protein